LRGEAVMSRALWYRRLCHTGADRLEQAVKGKVATGLVAESDTPAPTHCKPCIRGKHHHNPFPQRASHRATSFLERIHSDLHRLLVLTSTVFRYWLLFIDDYLRYFWIYLLRKKSEMFDAFMQFKAMVEKEFDKSILCLHNNKGGEFIAIKWNTSFVQHGIRHEHTVKASPQQNGFAERLNCTLKELLVTMLSGAHLPARFWGKGLNYLHHVIVHSPSSLIPLGTTPYEMAIPLPFEPAVPPSDSDSSSSSSRPSSTASLTPSPLRTPPHPAPAPALAPPRTPPQAAAPGPLSAPRPAMRIAPWPAPPKHPLRAPAVPAPTPRAPAPVPAPTPAINAPEPAGPRHSARSNAGVAPPSNWYNAIARMQGKVLDVPVVSYRKTGMCSSSCGRARVPAPSHKPSAGPSSLAPTIPNAQEKEEAAPGAPREPPAADDGNDNLYTQPQARLAHRLALDGAAELPADVRALLAQGLRSIYNNNNKYIELPKAMERAFRAAINTKAVVSDAEPKPYHNANAPPGL
jgi:hypothetical protein